jgi:hypothetical protein
MNEVLVPFVCFLKSFYLYIYIMKFWGAGGVKEGQQWRRSGKGKEGMTIVNGLGGGAAAGGGGGMGMCKVVGMCHNMLSFLLVTTTSNTIAKIDEIPLGLLMLLLLMPWDIVHLIALATLFDLL